MRFGLFSNGFRPATSACHSYEEDIREIVLADRLGFDDAYVSEHHGEMPYVGRVDTIPVPDMLMCKAAGLTTRIRMGSAVKLIHLQHPLDVAIQAAVADHLLGRGRYIFGFGTGFASPLFSGERGLAFEDRHARLLESLDAVLKCWSSPVPFDLDGRFWQGKGLVALPKPLEPGGPAMATATDSDAMIRIAAERGYTLLAAHVDTPARIRARSAKYMQYAAAAGRPANTDNISAARLVYIADSRQQALDDLRPAITFEVSVQAERGFLGHMKRTFGIDVPNDERALDALVGTGTYIIGDSGEVADQLTRFHAECGGFGTLLIVAGKSWATPEKRDRSMRAFMSDVAPVMSRAGLSRPAISQAA